MKIAFFVALVPMKKKMMALLAPSKGIIIGFELEPGYYKTPGPQIKARRGH